MVKDIAELLKLDRGLALLVGVVVGLGVGWYYVLPRMTEDKTILLRERNNELTEEREKIKKEIAELKTKLDGLQAEIMILTQDVPIESKIFQKHNERKTILTDLQIGLSGLANVNQDGTFSVDFDGSNI